MAFHERGERVKSSVLREHQVRAARAAYASGGRSVRDLAEEHGVSATAMARALRGESWAHLPLEPAPSKSAQQALRARRCWESRRAP